jgi:tRNA threonylcarbamoyladenosine biosynthesis protein TsaB
MISPGQEFGLKILSLDTSTPRGSIALMEGREVAGELRLQSQETHSARLLTGIGFLLNSTGWELADVNLIVVGIGPGSFTGIRIGAATALGLAQSLAAAFVGISGLDALAHQLPGVEGRIGVVMDAQRSQVYYAEYISSHGRIRKDKEPALLDPENLARNLRGTHVHLIGNGAMRYASALKAPKAGWPRLVDADLYLAGSLGRVALDRKRWWQSGACLSCKPLYIRPPDATKPRRK